jgi:AbiV family abortive infection protein
MSDHFPKDVYDIAWKESLENSKLLLADARILIEHESYGHAIALAVFSDEELAKTYWCWLVAKGLIPKGSKVVHDAFSRHDSKHLTQLGVIGGLWWQELVRKDKAWMIEVALKFAKPTKEMLEKDVERLREIAVLREHLRQDAVYVKISKGKVHSPSEFTREYAEFVVAGVEERLASQERLMIDPKPEELATLSKLFESLPKEAIDTGEIPVDWLFPWMK